MVSESPPNSGSPVDGDSPAEADVSQLDKETLIERFLAGSARDRRQLLKALRPQLEAQDVIRIAPVMRDPSPKISARIVALLARHGLRELFESLLLGLKPGKVEILRRHYDRISA